MARTRRIGLGVPEPGGVGAAPAGYATADEGIEPPLSEAVDALVGPLPGVGEPEGPRRADGGLVPVTWAAPPGVHRCGGPGLRSVRPLFR